MRAPEINDRRDRRDWLPGVDRTDGQTTQHDRRGRLTICKRQVIYVRTTAIGAVDQVAKGYGDVL